MHIWILGVPRTSEMEGSIQDVFIFFWHNGLLKIFLNLKFENFKILKIVLTQKEYLKKKGRLFDVRTITGTGALHNIIFAFMEVIKVEVSFQFNSSECLLM